jgi:hypothetical protein
VFKTVGQTGAGKVSAPLTAKLYPNPLFNPSLKVALYTRAPDLQQAKPPKKAEKALFRSFDLVNTA